MRYDKTTAEDNEGYCWWFIIVDVTVWHESDSDDDDGVDDHEDGDDVQWQATKLAHACMVAALHPRSHAGKAVMPSLVNAGTPPRYRRVVHFDRPVREMFDLEFYNIE